MGRLSWDMRTGPRPFPRPMPVKKGVVGLVSAECLLVWQKHSAEALACVKH